MEQIVSKEEINELMKIKGEISGRIIKAAREYLVKEKGEEGMKKVRDAMTKLGYPINYRKIKSTDYYPLHLTTLTLLISKRLFNFDDKKFQEMGEFESKSSIIIRIFLKYFVSLEKLLKEAPKMWRKYFSIGDLKIVERNQEKNL
ncbi:hypothetical protein KJA15_03430 [Patescibacteria group bacterium]|nr:hypothetical protein [Patescibacteria group bacterium]